MVRSARGAAALAHITLTGTVVPGFVAVTIFTSSLVVRHRAGRCYSDDHVARLEAALVGRAARFDAADDGAGARLEAEVLVPRRASPRVTLDADPAADHLAGRAAAAAGRAPC